MKVQQWDGLIAVSYPARAAGVTRHMRVQEAKEKCPDLICVHVQTLGEEGPARGEMASGLGHQPDRSREKASLEIYRRESRAVRSPYRCCALKAPGALIPASARASLCWPTKASSFPSARAQILRVLHEKCQGAVIEKASIDEVFIDATALVEAELNSRGGLGAPTCDGGASLFSWNSVVLAGERRGRRHPFPLRCSIQRLLPVAGPLNPELAFDHRLAVAAEVACRLRGAILEVRVLDKDSGCAGHPSLLVSAQLQRALCPRRPAVVWLHLFRRHCPQQAAGQAGVGPSQAESADRDTPEGGRGAFKGKGSS